MSRWSLYQLGVIVLAGVLFWGLRWFTGADVTAVASPSMETCKAVCVVTGTLLMPEAMTQTEDGFVVVEVQHKQTNWWGESWVTDPLLSRSPAIYLSSSTNPLEPYIFISALNTPGYKLGDDVVTTTSADGTTRSRGLRNGEQVSVYYTSNWVAEVRRSATPAFAEARAETAGWLTADLLILLSGCALLIRRFRPAWVERSRWTQEGSRALMVYGFTTAILMFAFTRIAL